MTLKDSQAPIFHCFSPVFPQRRHFYRWVLMGTLFLDLFFLVGQGMAQTSPQQNLIKINLLYVNPQTGNDGTGQGTLSTPFKTITHALTVASPNTAIVLAPGTYTEGTGEKFPLILKPDVIIQGNPQNRGENILIQGSGYFISPSSLGQNITILGADRAGLSGVTVRNSSERGYGVWIESSSPILTDNRFIGNTHDGVSVVGNSQPIIKGNYFSRNGANGITLWGQSRGEVRENVFENTGFGINISQNSSPLIIGNRITFNKDGIVIQASARPRLRKNYIERNQRDGIVTIAEASPDLGSPQEPGENTIRNNGRYDLHNGTNHSIQSFGNQLFQHRVVGSISFSGTERPPLNIPTLNRGEIYGRSSRKVPEKSAVSPLPIVHSVNSARINSSAFSGGSSFPSQGIKIPVPLPENRSFSSAENFPQSSGNPLISAPSTPLSSQGLLPVPRVSIPIGKGGYVPRALIGSTFNSGLTNSSSFSGFNPGVVLRYRVIVEVSNEAEEAQVRSLVPQAFNTVLQGQRFLQAGAFYQRDKATQLLQQLISYGLKARIENMN